MPLYGQNFLQQLNKRQAILTTVLFVDENYQYTLVLGALQLAYGPKSSQLKMPTRYAHEHFSHGIAIQDTAFMPRSDPSTVVRNGALDQQAKMILVDQVSSHGHGRVRRHSKMEVGRSVDDCYDLE